MKAIQINTEDTSYSTNYDNDRFNELINAIEQHNVLLIIGHDFEFNKDSEENKGILKILGSDANLYDYILYILKKQYNSTAIDFSELSEDAKFSGKEGNIYKHRNIYNEINTIIDKMDLSITDVNPMLISLIKTGYFRFVFTISFSPLVEKVMQEQWGEKNVRILNVFSDKVNNDIIDEKSDLLTPTIYYLFGKAGEQYKYVVTDNDILDVLQRWQSTMKGSKIIKATQNNYLLALGCTQDNWLFRFIWYSLKGRNNLSKGGVGLYANNYELEEYLKRNSIYKQKDLISFVKRITEALAQRKRNNYLMNICSDCEIFISYSRKDGDVANAVYNALTKQGLKVWYDRYNLGGRGGDFMTHIYNAIDNCKIFIPIFTPTITSQRKESHPYRLEWDRAVESVIKSRGVDSCIPIIDQNYNIYDCWSLDKIPEIIKKQDGYIFNRITLDFELWAKQVRDNLLKYIYNE